MKISRAELVTMAERMFGNFVKAVVDLEQGVMMVDAELHADQEAALLERGSKQLNLWGINLYPTVDGTDWLEFDSMINLRPSQGNRSRSVEDVTLQQQICELVDELVTE